MGQGNSIGLAAAQAMDSGMAFVYAIDWLSDVFCWVDMLLSATSFGFHVDAYAQPLGSVHGSARER